MEHAINQEPEFSPDTDAEYAEIIDRQHKQIMLMHQELRAAIVEDTGMERILECSQNLITATLLHFVSEESAIAARFTRHLEAHQKVHGEMIDSLKNISDDLELRKLSGAMELINFFEGRLSYHLSSEDAALARELTS